MNIIIVLILGLATLAADIKSTTGNIHFDVDRDGSGELGINADAITMNTDFHVQSGLTFNTTTTDQDMVIAKQTVIFANTATQSIQLTLPSAVDHAGKVILIKKMSHDHELIVVCQNETDRIDGQRQLLMSNSMESSNDLPQCRLISSGSSWFVQSTTPSNQLYNGALRLLVKTDNPGSSNDQQFTLPLRHSDDLDVTIDWGDGGTSSISSNTAAGLTHTYAQIGNYTVSISENNAASFSAIHFDGQGDAQKLLEIREWGPLHWETFESSFEGCVNMIITAKDHSRAITSDVTSFKQAFAQCSALTSFPMLDTSAVVNMDDAWDGCSSLTSFPHLNTTKVERFQRTWRGTEAMTSFPDIDTSSATTLSSTWAQGGLQEAPDIDLSTAQSFAFIFSNLTLSTTSWSAFLVKLADQTTRTGIKIHAGSSLLNDDGEAAALDLIDNENWQIYDGVFDGNVRR